MWCCCIVYNARSSNTYDNNLRPKKDGFFFCPPSLPVFLNTVYETRVNQNIFKTRNDGNAGPPVTQHDDVVVDFFDITVCAIPTTIFAAVCVKRRPHIFFFVQND